METRNLYKLMLPLGLGKSFIYASQYRFLYNLSRIFSFVVSPPHQEKDKGRLLKLLKGIYEIHDLDARNVAEGFYPPPVDDFLEIPSRLKNFPRIILDSAKIGRRRKIKKHKDFGDEAKARFRELPDYFKRNFHFQTDGYLTESSARRYDHQVEILFSGTAQSMRRMLIREIKQHPNFKAGVPLRILEIGAGNGIATRDFIKSFEISQYVVSDLSEPYLNVARLKIKDERATFVKCAGEALPFKDNSFDLVFSVFLFHEIPQAVREKIMKESKRVLKRRGLVAVCDSIQIDDRPELNAILENFPKDYHEPFYKDYSLHPLGELFTSVGFKKVESHIHLLSKYVVASKA